MFTTRRGNKQFGFIDVLISTLLPAVINVAGTVASAKITAGAAKDVAKSQAQNQLAAAKGQEKVAKLQLQAIQTSTVTQPAPSLAASIIPSSLMETKVAGIPIIYVLGGAAIFIFLIRR